MFYGLAFKGLNLGLDFTGGTQIEIKAPQISAQTMRHELWSTGEKDVTIQAIGAQDEYLVRFGDHLTQSSSEAIIKKHFPKVSIISSEFIGPQVGEKMISQGVLAVFVSILVTMIYIAIRFEIRFACSAMLSLIHDPILILGIFSWCQIEFNLIALAALLTMLGYSLNDTIVVYDRIRENFRKIRKQTPNEIVNLSINQTLSRTIMTSSLTLLVVLCIWIFGGMSLRSFAIALTIGIVVGTYSSIYIAGSVAVMMGLNRDALSTKSAQNEALV